jgi:hypothetical protein
MPRRRAVTALATLALLLAGCAGSPTKRWAQARETLTVTQDTTVELWDAGQLEPETMLVMDPAVQAARAALAAAEARLPDGPGVDAYLDAAEAALQAIARAQTIRPLEDTP